MYPQKNKSMGVKPGLYGGQLFGLPLLICQQGNRLSREVRTMAQKWAGALSCWKLRPQPLSMGAQSSVTHPGKLQLWL
jgi:hypothetical protein